MYVGKNALLREEIRETPHDPDFIALKNPAVALDGLHQGACFALLGNAALAVTVSARARLQRVDDLRSGGEIVSCDEACIERLLALNTVEV